jgi:adenylosuccinate lyase
MQRTEVNEVREAFSKNQKGSSAMPHKKNPIGSENISGLSRVLRGYALAANENIPL